MATIITPQVGNSYCPQLRFECNITADNPDNVTVSWQLVYVAHGYAISGSGNRTFAAVLNGSVVASIIKDVSGISSNVLLATGNTTVAKTHSSRLVAISCTADFGNVKWSGVTMGGKSATGSFSVGAQTSYAVKYNANGGTGAPGQQTKWYGEALTLSTVQPTKTGNNFDGWATSSGGARAYWPGDNYTANAAVTLYARWALKQYAIFFFPNGGTGGPSQATKVHGVTLTLPTSKPTRTNYTFVGWATSASATTAQYQPGGAYTENVGQALYAVWKLAYTKPRITNLDCARCTSAGALNDEGTYAKVTFNWATDKSVSSISVGGSAVSASGTSGSVSKVIGGSYSTETQYTISVSVSDGGGTTSDSTTLPPTKYIIDVANGGNGIAFGRTASSGGWADFGFPACFYNTVTYKGRQQGLGGQGLQGSTTQYLEIARSDLPTNSNSASGHITIRGSLGGYIASARGPFEIMFTVRETDANSDVKVVTRSNNINYSYCDLLICRESSGYLHAYIQLPAGKYYTYHVMIEGFGFTVPNTLVNTPVGTVMWRLSSAALSMYPVGTVLMRYDTTSPASLYGGTWALLPEGFIYSASGQTVATGGSNNMTLTTAQMPAHTHGIQARVASDHNPGGTVFQGSANSGAGWYTSTAIKTVSAGSTASISKIPLYIRLKIWRRTA